MIAQLDKEQIRLQPSRAAARLISHLLLQGRPLTTKARWLNYILFPQYSLVKKLPQLKPVQKPIFVLGTGRSGTTILGKLLSIHPQICFLNEPKAIWHSIYPKEDLIGSYSRGAASYRLFAKDATPEIHRAAHRLYGYALTITASRRILDKYPELIFRIPFVKSIFPDAKFIFLVRNGWDTSLSIHTWSQNESIALDQEKHDWWGANKRKWNLLLRDVVASNETLAAHLDEIRKFDNQSDMGAVEWIVTMQEGLDQIKNDPHAIHQLHYETLVKEPVKSLTELLDFCELPNDKKVMDYAQKTVRPAAPKKPFSLHPAIAPYFQDTMQRLGYNLRKMP